MSWRCGGVCVECCRGVDAVVCVLDLVWELRLGKLVEKIRILLESNATTHYTVPFFDKNQKQKNWVFGEDLRCNIHTTVHVAHSIQHLSGAEGRRDRCQADINPVVLLSSAAFFARLLHPTLSTDEEVVWSGFAFLLRISNWSWTWPRIASWISGSLLIDWGQVRDSCKWMIPRIPVGSQACKSLERVLVDPMRTKISKGSRSCSFIFVRKCTHRHKF